MIKAKLEEQVKELKRDLEYSRENGNEFRVRWTKLLKENEALRDQINFYNTMVKLAVKK